jgi:hypothetical protein
LLHEIIFLDEATKQVKYYRDQFNKNPYGKDNPVVGFNVVSKNPFVVDKKEQRKSMEESEYLKLVDYGYETLNPNFFIHFTNHEGELVPFTGSRWNTPYGIYGYPINGKEVAYQAKQGIGSEDDDEGLPYGRNFKYVIFFKLKEYEKLLVMDSYTEEQYQQDKGKLLSMYGNNVDLHNAFSFIEADQENNQSQSYDDVGGGQTISNPAQKLLFGLNNFLKQKHSEKYQEKINQRRANKNQNFTNLNSHVIELSAVLTKLGYVGLCDLGNRFIGREYSQAVIFSSKFIQILKQIKNPSAKTEQHRNNREVAVNKNILSNPEKLKQKLIKADINPAMFPGADNKDSSFELVDVKTQSSKDNNWMVTLSFKQRPNALDLEVKLVEAAVEGNLRARTRVFKSIKDSMFFIRNKEINSLEFENGILTAVMYVYGN